MSKVLYHTNEEKKFSSQKRDDLEVFQIYYRINQLCSWKICRTVSRKLVTEFEKKCDKFILIKRWGALLKSPDMYLIGVAFIVRVFNYSRRNLCTLLPPRVSRFDTVEVAGVRSFKVALPYVTWSKFENSWVEKSASSAAAYCNEGANDSWQF